MKYDTKWSKRYTNVIRWNYSSSNVLYSFFVLRQTRRRKITSDIIKKNAIILNLMAVNESFQNSLWRRRSSIEMTLICEWLTLSIKSEHFPLFQIWKYCWLRLTIIAPLKDVLYYYYYYHHDCFGECKFEYYF